MAKEKVETKWCYSCEKDLPLTEFWKDYSQCKECHRRMKQRQNDMTRRRSNRCEMSWTTEEVNFVRDNYERMTDTEIALELSRTRSGVTGMRIKLGLIKKEAPKVGPDDIREYLLRASSEIPRITVSLQVEAKKLVVFAPSDYELTSVEDEFIAAGLSPELFSAWMMSKRRC